MIYCNHTGLSLGRGIELNISVAGVYGTMHFDLQVSCLSLLYRHTTRPILLCLLKLHCDPVLALKEYEPSMQACIDQLVEKIKDHAASGSPVDMTRWFGCLMFDVRSPV